MSKKQSQKSPKKRRGRERQIRIRGQLRREPDLGRIARTVVDIAIAQAEKEAQEEAAQLADQKERRDD